MTPAVCACETEQVDADVDAPVCASVGFWDMARTIKTDIDAFAKQPHLVRAAFKRGAGGYTSRLVRAYSRVYDMWAPYIYMCVYV
jgi:hypothetical protein